MEYSAEPSKMEVHIAIYGGPRSNNFNPKRRGRGLFIPTQPAATSPGGFPATNAINNLTGED